VKNFSEEQIDKKSRIGCIVALIICYSFFIWLSLIVYFEGINFGIRDIYSNAVNIVLSPFFIGIAATIPMQVIRILMLKHKEKRNLQGNAEQDRLIHQ
jgi:hypothetical protein